MSSEPTNIKISTNLLKPNIISSQSLHSSTSKPSKDIITQIQFKTASKIRPNQHDELFPQNYYNYHIDRHLKTDFHNINAKKNENIYTCCFRIVQSKPGRAFAHPFLQFLLYKYPSGNKQISDLCVFPFNKFQKKTVLETGKDQVKSIFADVYNCLGYIQNEDGIFLFYQIDSKHSPKRWDKEDDLWWALIDEICNHKKILN